MMIADPCILCDACIPVCPNQAITHIDVAIYIDPERCTECVGAYETQQCVAYCPVPEAIVADPANVESREALAMKYEALQNAPETVAPERPKRRKRNRQ